MAFNRGAYLTSLNVFRRRSGSRLYSAETKLKVSGEFDQPEIIVPYRIPRSSTDILKALASTVKKDYTALNYKYHDDPYLIPASNIAKRSFALSKESGKKAARYFLEKYPDIFKCNKSDPVVQAFEPPLQFTENDDVTEATLQSCINSIDVSNAITVYELLGSKGVPLKQETKQQLLELLCFYNSTVPPREEYYEDRWFSRREENVNKNTWLSNGLAEKLFQEMEKDSAAYCAMIQGTAKYCNAQEAFLLYEEMREKKLNATLETYNSLLMMTPYMKEDGDMRWELAMELVNHMNSESIRPDLYTMHALLSIIASSRRWDKGRSLTLQILAEMKRLDIEPSLGTYYYLLVIFYRNSRGFVSILPQIVNKIDKKELEIRHPNDVLFFHTAMEACRKIDYDKDLAHQIHALVEHGSNSKLLGSAVWESVYFQNYFNLMSHAEDFEKFMELYEKYIPNVYTPEPNVMFEIINALYFNKAYKHLPRIFSDVIVFEQTERLQVMSELFRVASHATLEEKDQEIVMNFVWSIVEKIDRRAETNMRRVFQWTGSMFGHILQIFVNGKDLEKSWIIMQRLKNEEFSIVGYPEEDCLVAFCKLFLEAKDFEKVDFCVKYAMFTTGTKMKTELEKIVNDFYERKILDETDRPKIDAILGKMGENNRLCGH